MSACECVCVCVTSISFSQTVKTIHKAGSRDKAPHPPLVKERMSRADNALLSIPPPPHSPPFFPSNPPPLTPPTHRRTDTNKFPLPLPTHSLQGGKALSWIWWWWWWWWGVLLLQDANTINHTNKQTLTFSHSAQKTNTSTDTHTLTISLYHLWQKCV